MFATLSPVPGFRRWLDGEAKKKAPDFFGRQERERLCEAADAKDPHEALAQLMLRGFAAEAQPPASLEADAHPARGAVPRGGERGRRRGRSIRSPGSTSATAPASSAINWLADSSPRGIKQSAGMMVNYLYKLDEIENEPRGVRARGPGDGGRRGEAAAA